MTGRSLASPGRKNDSDGPEFCGWTLEPSLIRSTASRPLLPEVELDLGLKSRASSPRQLDVAIPRTRRSDMV